MAGVMSVEPLLHLARQPILLLKKSSSKYEVEEGRRIPGTENQ